MAINKAWQDCDQDTASRLPGALGVYELGDAMGSVLYIGIAGGKSQFGLRGEILAKLQQSDMGGIPAVKYRYEVNMMYMTRFVELLERHQDAVGTLPPLNTRPGEYVPRIVRRRAARYANGKEVQ